MLSSMTGIVSECGSAFFTAEGAEDRGGLQQKMIGGACLAYELRCRGLNVLAQHPLPLVYRGTQVELGYRLDLLVDDAVIVELKTVRKFGAAT